MVAVNYTTLRDKLKDYCDKATDKHEIVIVTRKNEKNVVIISLEQYNELSRIARNAEYLAKLDMSFEQLDNGQFKEHDIIEVDDE